MPHCECSMMVHLSPDAIAVINQAQTPLGEILKTFEDVFLGHPGSQPAIRESVKELLDRNLYFATDMNAPHQNVTDDLGVLVKKFAADYEKRRQDYKVYWAAPHTNVRAHLQTDPSQFASEPVPTCARWGWVNGEIVCEYNYGIALVPKTQVSGSTPMEKLDAMTDGLGAFHINLHLEGAHVDDVWP